MKQRRTKKLLAFILTAAMMVMMISTMVSAASTSGFTYTPIDGPSNLKLKKVIILPNETPVPEAGFAFEVAAGTAVAPTDTAYGIKPGIITGGKPSVADATFTFNETKDTTPDAATTTKYDTSCTKEVAIDFTGVQFTEPGVYRYIITEVDAVKDATSGAKYSNTAIAKDNPIVMDVYVVDKVDSTTGDKILEIAGTTMVHADNEANVVPTKDGNDPAAADKTDKFVNEYPTSTLELTKTVTGNQGSKDQWFEFTITVTDPTGETIDENLDIQISGQTKEPAANDATSYTAAQMKTQNNVSTIKWSALKAGYKIYLQNGDDVTIHGIPEGAKVDITEVNLDYSVTTSVTEGSGTAVTGNTAAISTITIADKDFLVEYTNNKEGIIPTGVLLSATPWIILGIVLIAGIVFFAIRSKKKYEDE